MTSGPSVHSLALGAVPIVAITFSAVFAVVLVAALIYIATRAEPDNEENQVYLELGLDEQELYFQARDFLREHQYFKDSLSYSQQLLISEKGVKAWEFVKDPMLTNNDLLVANKCELNFFKRFECSVQTNLPLPMANDTYYFECKLFSFPLAETTVSVGLASKPYPWFRLGGRHPHLVCYDSTGHRRHNQPLPPRGAPAFPPLIEGDVVGVGYRMGAGTVFFTRNGKKVSELRLGGHVKFKIPERGQLYPLVSANNLCSVHVNLGQMGFVFIEANVKKWGFAPLEGNGPAPPVYNKFSADILLERLDVDPLDLADRSGDFPPEFGEAHNMDNDKFSYNAYSEIDTDDERISLKTIITHGPPEYDLDTTSN